MLSLNAGTGSMDFKVVQPSSSAHATEEEERMSGESATSKNDVEDEPILVSGEKLLLGYCSDARPLKRGVWASLEREDAWLAAAAKCFRSSRAFSCVRRENGAEKLSSGLCQGASRRASQKTIPKIVHMIWLGGDKPHSANYVKWFESWKSHHPDWKIMWWTDDSVADLRARSDLKNSRAFDEAKNYGEKSDILRYEIIERFGGLYADTDMECVASFDSLHDSGVQFYAGWSNTGTVEVNNGIFGSVANHPLLTTIVERIGKSFNSRECNEKVDLSKMMDNKATKVGALLSSFLGAKDQGASNMPTLQGISSLSKLVKQNAFMATIAATGPGMFTKETLNYLLRVPPTVPNNIVVLPVEVFYPLANNQSSKDACVTSSTLAIHHWMKSWQSKE